MKYPAYSLIITLLLSVAASAQIDQPDTNSFSSSGQPLAASVGKPYLSERYENVTIKRTENPYAPAPATGETVKAHVPSETTYTTRNAMATLTVYDGVPEAKVERKFVAPEYKMISSGSRTSSGNYLKGATTGDDTVDGYILASSRRYDIDPLLIYAQMGQESSYKPRALSHKGASGLMQLMPATARRLGVTNIYDPKQNIEGGVKYMRILLNMFDGDLALALAGYNAGEGAVIKYGYKIPPYAETRDYVKRISARYNSLSRR